MLQKSSPTQLHKGSREEVCSQPGPKCGEAEHLHTAVLGGQATHTEMVAWKMTWKQALKKCQMDVWEH